MENTNVARVRARRQKRSLAERAADQAEVARLHLRGLNQAEIAEELTRLRGRPVARSVVQYDLAQVAQSWLEEAKAARATAVARQLRKLEVLSVRAWEALERADEEGKISTCIRTHLEIHDRISRLLGLDAAQKHELSGPGGGPISLAAESDLPRERKIELLRRHLERLEIQPQAVALPASEVKPVALSA